MWCKHCLSEPESCLIPVVCLVAVEPPIQRCSFLHQLAQALLLACLQCKSYLSNAGDLRLGLNLINTTNLDYFQPQQQAELWRLKGLLLQVSAGAFWQACHRMLPFSRAPRLA